MLRVSLIEDDTVFCELVREKLRSTGTLQLASCYQTAEDALRQLPRERPHPPAVALVDIQLPCMDGIECVRRFRALPNPPTTHFIILTQHDAEDLIVRALRVGVHGFLTKDRIAGGDLATAIQDVIAGGAFLSPRIARKIISFYENAPVPEISPATRLTAREKEVLELVSDGLPDKHIADRLSISENTVHKCLSGIYQKLDVPSRAAATAKFARQTTLHSIA